MTRGMRLDADGLSLKDMSDVHYPRHPQARLTALTLMVAVTTG